MWEFLLGCETHYLSSLIFFRAEVMNPMGQVGATLQQEISQLDEVAIVEFLYESGVQTMKVYLLM